MGQGGQVRGHQADLIEASGTVFHNLPFGESRGADVREQALRCDRADCIVEDCEQAVRGLRREYFFSTFQSARSILEPSRTVLDATTTKWRSLSEGRGPRQMQRRSA